jgi:hypothetical protein
VGRGFTVVVVFREVATMEEHSGPRVTSLRFVSRIVLAIVCVAGAALRAGAQGASTPAVWTSTNGPLGAVPFTLSSMVIDPANPATIYVGTLGFGVFKSSDAGASRPMKCGSSR